MEAFHPLFRGEAAIDTIGNFKQTVFVIQRQVHQPKVNMDWHDSREVFNKLATAEWAESFDRLNRDSAYFRFYCAYDFRQHPRDQGLTISAMIGRIELRRDHSRLFFGHRGESDVAVGEAGGVGQNWNDVVSSRDDPVTAIARSPKNIGRRLNKLYIGGMNVLAGPIQAVDAVEIEVDHQLPGNVSGLGGHDRCHKPPRS